MTTYTSRPKPELLHPQEVKLLQAQTMLALLEVEQATIVTAKMEDEERDRLVKSGRVRHLNINDAIAGSNTDIWIQTLQHWERRDPGGPITIDINSPGGVVTDGLALYDQIMRMRRGGHVFVTRGVGLVASMAGVLLQAGDTRVMDARAKLLIHEGASTFSGTFTTGEQEDYRVFGKLLREDILDILAERSTLSKRQIALRWKRKDWYLTAAEALKLGFVDVVE